MGRREKQNEIGLFLCVWDFWLEQMGGWWSHLFKRGSLKDIYWLMRKTRVISKYGWIGANGCLIFFFLVTYQNSLFKLFSPPKLKKIFSFKYASVKWFCRESYHPWDTLKENHAPLKMRLNSKFLPADNWAWGSDSALLAWH